MTTGTATAAWTLLPSPVGELLLTTDGAALTAVFFERHRGGHDERPDVLARGGTRDDAHPVLAAATTQLAEYFDRRGRVFDLPLAPAGTVFQQRVWQALLDIPVRDDDELRRDRPPPRAASWRLARRRPGERLQPDLDHRSVSPRRRAPTVR